MKKLMALMIAAIMVFSLAACGEKTAPVSSPPETQASIEESPPSPSPTPEPKAEEIIELEDEESQDEEPEEEEEVILPVASPDLSSDWSSYQYELNGVIYTLPTPYAELEANGWTPDKNVDLTDTLNKSQYTIGSARLWNGNDEISVTFYNPGDEELPFSECYIGGIKLFETSRGKTVLIFPGNVTMGSLLEDVESLYGEPMSKEEGSSIRLKYERGNYNYVGVDFNPETEKATYLGMFNLHVQ